MIITTTRFRLFRKVFSISLFFATTLPLCIISSCAGDLPRGNSHILVPDEYLVVQQDITFLPDSPDTAFICSSPQPFTGVLKFRSRYEGSGKARDQVSQAAEQAYEERTEKIASLERFITTETDRIMQGLATEKHLDCLFDTLLLWANQSTLLLETDNHTGKAVRKWLLATISSNLLKITDVAEEYKPHEYAEVKQWISNLADQVVSDYSDDPIEKINNHHYWAAWAVITSAAVLDDENLYSWAESVFIAAMDQVEEGGYLPNELRRASRATLYHNYALAPLVGVAAFLRANGKNPFKYNDQALARLTSRVVHSVSTTNSFTRQTGVKQIEYNLTGKGRITWVTLYRSIADLGPADLAHKCKTISESRFPLRSTRLGGDLRYIFLNKTNNNQQ